MTTSGPQNVQTHTVTDSTSAEDIDITPCDDKESAAYALFAPAQQTIPLVFASPHSGRNYPEEFLRQTTLPPALLRLSEDGFVDELFTAAPRLGAPLLAARFPRVLIDPNRAPDELDPSMFDEPLPPETPEPTLRVRAGLGIIPRLAANEAEIYATKLPLSEWRRRMTLYYEPYHRHLANLMMATRQKFGLAILIDCHSMPSPRPGMRSETADYILGDCFGAACDPRLTDAVEQSLRHQGARVRRNTPYPGGYVTRLYGQPHKGLHALQIEIGRALYMDEATLTKTPEFQRIKNIMTSVIQTLAATGRRMEIV